MNWLPNTVFLKKNESPPPPIEMDMCTELIWFQGISIIVGYLILNPFLYIKTVQFQTIQFSMST